MEQLNKNVNTILIFLGLSILGQAQTPFWSEDFETDGAGTRYTSDNEFQDSASDYYGRVEGSTSILQLPCGVAIDIIGSGSSGSQTGAYNGWNGSYFIAGEDQNDAASTNSCGSFNSSTAVREVIFTDININGASTITFKMLVAAGNMNACGGNTYDTNEKLTVHYTIDSNAETTDALCFRSNIECNIPNDTTNEPFYHDPNCDGDGGEGTLLTNTFQEFSFTIAGSGTTLDLRIEMITDDANSEIAFDNIRLEAVTHPIQANQAPVANCQNITIPANGDCQGMAQAADFDNVSTDPDGDNLLFTVSPEGPYALGETPVILTVSDGELSTQCPATVTVQDMTPPIISGGSSGFSYSEKLTASDAAADDRFGERCSIDGNQAIIAADWNQDNGSRSGSIYFFEKNASGNWIEKQKLVASDGASNDRFGFSVSISGDYAIASAMFNDDNGSDSGSAYIFEKNASGTWVETQKLIASDATSQDRFGWDVSISGNQAIASATWNDDSGSKSGSAYVYERNASGTWVEVQKLLASDAAAGDNFGQQVFIEGDQIMVGAHLDDTGAPNENGGSVYMFEKDGSGPWVETQKLVPADIQPHDGVGNFIGISGNYAVVGATQRDHIGNNSGVAFVFEKDGSGTWVEAQKLVPSDSAIDDNFGTGVFISGNTILITANGDDDNGSNSGSVYVFERDGSGTWVETQKLLAPDGAADDRWGTNGISMSGNTALITSYNDDDNGSGSGSAYIFNLAPLLPDLTGECTVTATAPTAMDNCAGMITGTTSDPTIYNSEGTYTINWTFNDLNGNSFVLPQQVIIEDVTPPVPSCKDITINLSEGYYFLQASEINDHSSDNCGTPTTVIIDGQNSYTCADIGSTYTLTLRVQANNGAIETCTANVTVADAISNG